MIVDTHAVGMAVKRPNGLEIDFVRNLFSGSAAWFFLSSLYKFLHPFLKSKFMKKVPWLKKMSFS